MKNEDFKDDDLKFAVSSYLSLGIDVGSTTIKFVLIKNGSIIFECYERHYSQIQTKTLEILKKIKDMIGDEPVKIAIAGSAGLGLTQASNIPFVQEVFATAECIKTLEKDVSLVIELGGEDAKVIFFDNGLDERMNGSCAGGTGAFIDQMANLMDITPDELDALSLNSTQLYPIASRCGVFAKTDIQPLLNQGAKKEDVSASIYQAVVNQTITGLIQGKKIKGKVVFLGGPLYYCKGLQKRFTESLELTPDNARFPDYARFAVGIGAAIYASKQNIEYHYQALYNAIENAKNIQTSNSLNPLFKDKEEYNEFLTRHNKANVKQIDISNYVGNAYLGIDCGSTTTKLVLINENNDILYSFYDSNKGNPLCVLKEQLLKIYELCSDRITIKSSAATGYGEELVLNAYGVDSGVVETMAHYAAAKHFNPNVDFILDIGGQDIKCFKIRNNNIDSIILNEACSSGCGSFIETFSKALGYSIQDFSQLALFAKHPADLGSRCTVFMNSSVKQAQKDGATVSDISAGLSISVVKNAIYKVIRAHSVEELGEQIVVQGGTFLNNAILRSFELELGHNVIRPNIAGLMGAFGSALYAKKRAGKTSSLISNDDLKLFKHTQKLTTCNRCGNHCHLTINIFNDNKKYISGNQCDKGSGVANKNKDIPNLYQYKRDQLAKLTPKDGKMGTIGIPLALGMYELAPLWYTFFTELGFKVIISGFSNKELYYKGQGTIPSDTVCYPAKLMHGHIKTLLDQKTDIIFYPSLTYNIDEKTSKRCFNCPVVAYYSEILNGNFDDLHNTKFLYPPLNINNTKELARELTLCFLKNNIHFSFRKVLNAVNLGINAYTSYMLDIRNKGKEYLKFAKDNHLPVIVLAGRPYHIDPEICHNIDKLITSLGFVVVSEDSISDLETKFDTAVLNQWTYHSRLYSAATYVSKNSGINLVQLVSFGCGVDAITTDEVRSKLEKNNKLYTQIKIDEITNLGAVKIRLRSLQGALEERGEQS